MVQTMLFSMFSLSQNDQTNSFSYWSFVLISENDLGHVSALRPRTKLIPKIEAQSVEPVLSPFLMRSLNVLFFF